MYHHCAPYSLAGSQESEETAKLCGQENTITNASQMALLLQKQLNSVVRRTLYQQCEAVGFAVSHSQDSETAVELCGQ